MSYRVKSTYLPEQYDFAGNILDQYDQSTYQITLYMKQNFRSSDPADWPLSAGDVIIAQTGSTDIIIPSLRIENQLNANSLSTLSVKFTLEQPQSADLPDRIIGVKHKFGYGDYAETVLFMRIRFLGYTSDPDDNDGDGEPTKIGDDIYHRLVLNKIDIQIDEAGSRYDFEALDTQTSSASKVWRLPEDGQTIGTTISEHLESLQEKLNEFYQEQGHTFEFNPEFLLGDESAGLIKQEEIYIPDDAENFYERINSAAEAANSLGDYELRIRNTPTMNDSTTDAEYSETQDQRGIPYKRGQTLYEYMVTLLSANDEFYQLITRVNDIDNADSEVDNAIGVLRWIRVNLDHEVTGLDQEGHTLIKHYTITPTIFDSVRSDMVVDEAETTIDKTDGQARFDDMWNKELIKKSYDYLFTGLNDQVTNLDIRLDNAVSLLVGRRKGIQSQEAGGQLEAQVNTTQDPDERNRRDESDAYKNDVPPQTTSFAPELPGEPGNQYIMTGGYSYQNNQDTQRPTDKTTTVHEQESPIKKNSRRHTLFGHLVNQSVSDQFMLKLSMSVRGDPWYVDNGRIAPSTDNQLRMRLNDNCIFLTIRTPERHDPDYQDEDNNSGYWQFSNTSRMFSGVYRVLTATCVFENGVYTNDLECIHELGVNVIQGGSD